jgi:hypothetical protein
VQTRMECEVRIIAEAKRSNQHAHVSAASEQAPLNPSQSQGPNTHEDEGKTVQKSSRRCGAVKRWL